MKIVLIFIIGLLLLTIVTGCQESTPVQTQEQAAEQTIDIGEDVDDVGALLDDIDSDLG